MIAIASDHAATELKKHIIDLLETKGLEYKDFGPSTVDIDNGNTDYPIFGKRAADAVASGECDRGIVICGTGLGISLAANKVRGIRCAVCSEPYTAQMSRLHNDANMLALGARVVGVGLASQIVEIWLDTEFEGGRHARRVNLITDIESCKSIE